jgi:hypothetical protein
MTAIRLATALMSALVIVGCIGAPVGPEARAQAPAAAAGGQCPDSACLRARIQAGPRLLAFALGGAASKDCSSSAHGGKCETNLFVSIRNDTNPKQCFVRYEHYEIVTRKEVEQEDENLDCARRQKKRGKVEKVVWELKPEEERKAKEAGRESPRDLREFTLQEIELLPGPGGDTNRSDCDFDERGNDGKKQNYKWKNKHKRAVELCYCPHVLWETGGKKISCTVFDPLIVNK